MNRMTQEGKAKLEELVARVMKDGQARGIAVGIVNAAGEIQYENYFGYRDVENKLPITRDTIFGMASVTKSFTALSIMQMQQDGILKVDDPVSRYIPEFTNKNQSEPVKLWHLMCHSGGYFPLPRIVVDKTAQEMGIEDSLDAELIYREGLCRGRHPPCGRPPGFPDPFHRTSGTAHELLQRRFWSAF